MTSRSGLVSLPLIRDITLLRFSGDMMSPRCFPATGWPAAAQERCPAFLAIDQVSEKTKLRVGGCSDKNSSVQIAITFLATRFRE